MNEREGGREKNCIVMDGCMLMEKKKKRKKRRRRKSVDSISGSSGVISYQTLMRRFVHTPGRLQQQPGWPSTLSWLGI